MVGKLLHILEGAGEICLGQLAPRPKTNPPPRGGHPITTGTPPPQGWQKEACSGFTIELQNFGNGWGGGDALAGVGKRKRAKMRTFGKNVWTEKHKIHKNEKNYPKTCKNLLLRHRFHRKNCTLRRRFHGCKNCRGANNFFVTMYEVQI